LAAKPNSISERIVLRQKIHKINLGKIRGSSKFRAEAKLASQPDSHNTDEN
jgi:hypothetical protein